MSLASTNCDRKTVVLIVYSKTLERNRENDMCENINDASDT